MALTKKTAEDMNENFASNKLHEDGWYQAAFTKTESRQSKATQDMLSYSVRLLAEEGNPDSVAGAPIFGMVMFDSWDDDDAFRQSIADKKGLDGDALDTEVAKRRAQADSQVVNFGLAVFGEDEFPVVPRKCKETGKYLLPDGTPVTDAAERSAMFKARNAAAYSATVEVATGERDITRYVVYAKIAKGQFNGKEQNEIKALRSSLPAGETLRFP